MQKALVLALAASAEAFRMPASLAQPLTKLAAPAAAFAITVHSEAAHAKSVLGVQGALDFGPLAGDQPGGEGTGKVRAGRLTRPHNTAAAIGRQLAAKPPQRHRLPGEMSASAQRSA